MTLSLHRAVVLADVARGFVSRGRTVPVFRALEFAVTCGDRVALIGPNGSGKSTLLRLIAGLVSPDSGVVRVRDRCGMLVDPARRPGTCAAVLDGGRSLHGRLTIRENARYLAALDGLRAGAGERAVAPWLERFGLFGRFDDLAQTLSKGMQQKAAIALALSLPRPLLLLDEPTTLLDEAACHLLATILRERSQAGQTLIVATHDHVWRSRLEARSVALRPSGAGQSRDAGGMDTALRRPAAQPV